MSGTKYKMLTVLTLVVLFCDALQGKYLADHGKTGYVEEEPKIDVKANEEVEESSEEELYPSQGFLKDVILMIAKELNIDVGESGISSNLEDDDNTTITTAKPPTTTRDPLDVWCDTACKDGSAGAECDCPENPIG